MLPEQQQRIMGYFIEEAKDHLNTIEQGLLSLQATIEDSEKANEVFRAAHSVKGGAAMLGLESIQTIAHRMEDYFKILKESSVKVDSTLETMFLRVSDGLKDLLEQLEGPFGLTPEKAQSIMTDVDPVFGQLERHLESLVVAGGGVKSGAIAPTSAIADALQVTFKQDVSDLLRQLLSTFKQADTAESRKHLQKICTELSSVGQQFQLSAWCDLIETARLAAEEQSNEYRVLAPILIKEIKKSQDWVLAGRASEVGVSEAMQALLPDDILATIEDASSTDTVENNGLTDDESTRDAGLLFEDGLFDTEIDTSTEELNELFGLDTDSTELLEPERSPDVTAHITEWESELSSSTAEDVPLVEAFSTAAANGSIQEELAEEPTSRLNIELDFNEIPSELSALNRNAEVEERADESLDALLATVNVTGPDVGTEELNSLADLFDGDLEELDNTLGNHPFISEEMRLHPERIDLDDDDDLTDLLTDSSLTRSENSEDNGTADDIEDDLFGGTLTEGGFADVTEFNLDEEIGLDEETAKAKIFKTESPENSTFEIGDFEAESTETINEETRLSDAINEEKNEEKSLDTDLATLAEDPWAEEAEDNELESLFGANGVESITESVELDNLESADIAPETLSTDTDLSPEGISPEGISLEGLEENLFEAGSFEASALEEMHSEENGEGDDEGEKDNKAVPAQATVVGIELTKPPGNLSSGLFAVEPVSPSEQEIEFPTLTGIKLEAAEKDIDSFFFDSPDDESDDFLTEGSDGENSLVIPEEKQLSEDPWGELEMEGSLNQETSADENEDSSLKLDEFDLDASDLNEPDLDEPEPDQLNPNEPQQAEAADSKAADVDTVDFALPTISGELHNTSDTETSSTDDLFDIASPFSLETDSEEKPAIAKEDPNAISGLWDDSPLSPEWTETNDFDNTVFSAEPVTDIDVALGDELENRLSDDVALDNSALDDLALDDLLTKAPTEESIAQDIAKAADSESSSDFSALGDLFDGETDLDEAPTETAQSHVERSVSPDALSDNFLADESVDDWLTMESVATETRPAETTASASEDDLPTLDRLLNDFADDTVSTLGTAEEKNNLNGDDFLLGFEETGLGELENDLAQAQLSTEDELKIPTHGEVITNKAVGETSSEILTSEILSFDDLDSLLDGDSGQVEINDELSEEKLRHHRPSGMETGETDLALKRDSEEEEEDDFDDLERLLEDGDSENPSPATTVRRAAPRAIRRNNPTREQNMRVPVKHLDNLSNLVGELVVNRNTLERDQERLRQFLDNLLFQVQQLNDVGQRMRDLYERSLLESSLVSNRKAYAADNNQKTNEPENHATGATFDALEMDRFTGFHTLSQEMIELIVRVRESSSDIGYTVESSDQVTRQFRQVTTQLQEGLNTARMVAFSQAADRLPRAVRDIALKCGKEAQLIVEGKDTLIDKMIVEHLYDPLTHLVNNAITHGIETPEKRKAAGKLPEGSITVQAFYQGNQTVLYVADDGGGINPAFVQRKAVEKKLITQAEADQLSDIETYELLFHPGFSTRDQADDFAGRGVGMDVVRTSLAEIRGVITIDSEQGKGTGFTIRLPLTLSISKALSCVSNQARIAFPMDGVEDMLDVPRDRIIQNEQGQNCVKWRDRILPFQAVTDLLKFNRTLGRGRVYGGSQDDDVLSIIVLRSANTFVAIQVDQVIGEEEIVIKQLEGPVPKPLGIAGATILGDGRVMPIADVIELIDIAMGRVRREPSSMLWAEAAEAEAEVEVKADPTVLIVDDSITVRELLSMSFNKVGYRVEQARDGQEAWDKLRSGLPCDLVFCDIEMPRMDGLELLSRMQKDNHLKSVPIAMLTSRGADRHRQMAVDLGASGYFTKPYLEEALLDAAQRMLNGETLAKGRGG